MIWQGLCHHNHRVANWRLGHFRGWNWRKCYSTPSFPFPPSLASFHSARVGDGPCGWEIAVAGNLVSKGSWASALLTKVSRNVTSYIFPVGEKQRLIPVIPLGCWELMWLHFLQCSVFNTFSGALTNCTHLLCLTELNRAIKYWAHFHLHLGFPFLRHVKVWCHCAIEPRNQLHRWFWMNEALIYQNRWNFYTPANSFCTLVFPHSNENI